MSEQRAAQVAVIQDTNTKNIIMCVILRDTDRRKQAVSLAQHTIIQFIVQFALTGLYIT